MGTFFCSNCKRELNTKYLHKNGICVDCFIDPQKYKSKEFVICLSCGIEFDKTEMSSNIGFYCCKNCADKQYDCSEFISKINQINGVCANKDDILEFGKFIAEKFVGEYQFFKDYSMMGHGDVTFWWLFFSAKEQKIAVIDGIMYWGNGSILLNQPKFISLSEADKSSTLSISDISHKIVSEFNFSVSKEDAKEIYSLLNSNN